MQHLPSISQEQEKIISAVKSGRNVIVDAVAGSGKTTTILCLAATMPEKKILQLTYNSQLKAEVRAKAESLTNLEVHSYHSLFVKYYDYRAIDDAKVVLLLNANCPILSQPAVDILVIDEAQDMTSLHYRMITKFLTDLGTPVQLMVMGDKYQIVYGFKGADSRFLTLADRVWRKDFTRLTLQTSYRLTHQIAKFINESMLGHHRIRTIKRGPKVVYHRQNGYEIGKTIESLLLKYKVDPGDVFILSPSVRAKNGILPKIESRLLARWKCFVPINDEAALDKDVINNKIVFTTFHQSKGRERKVVFVVGFDQSYFEYYCRDSPENVCPPTLYVAATRATNLLYLFHSSSNKSALSFLRVQEGEHVWYRGGLPIAGKAGHRRHRSLDVDLTVASLLRFLSEDLIMEITESAYRLFDTEVEQEEEIDIPSKIKIVHNGQVTHEEVSDINGVVIPALWERKMVSGCVSICDGDRCVCKQGSKTEFIKLGIQYISKSSGYKFKEKQITDFSWLTDEMIEKCHLILSKNITYPTPLFEVAVPSGGDNRSDVEASHLTQSKNTLDYLQGRLDVVDEETVWEIKCACTLTIVHHLQLVFYSWIWRKLYPEKERKFRLLNIRTGERKVMKEVPLKEIEALIEKVYLARIEKKEELSDSQFLANISRIGNTC